MKDVLSTREVARILGVSEAQARKDYRGNKGVWYVKNGNRDLQWPTLEVQRYLFRQMERLHLAMYRLDSFSESDQDDPWKKVKNLTAETRAGWVYVKAVSTGGDWRENQDFPERSGTYLVTLKGNPNYVVLDEFDEHNDFWPWNMAKEDDLLAWAELPLAFVEAA